VTRRSPIVFESAASGTLPGTDYPAFSYLMLGALRGWADENHDGGVTAAEANAYVKRELHALHAGRPGSQPDLTSELDCPGLTTLSTANERPPDLQGLSA